MAERTLKETIRDEVRRVLRQEVREAVDKEVAGAVQEALEELPASIRRIAEESRSTSAYRERTRDYEPDMNYHN